MYTSRCKPDAVGRLFNLWYLIIRYQSLASDAVSGASKCQLQTVVYQFVNIVSCKQNCVIIVVDIACYLLSDSCLVVYALHETLVIVAGS